MKRLILCLLMATASSNPALAIPNLQLYSPDPGVYYDEITASWIIPHTQYDLWVVGAHLKVEDVKIAFAVPNDENGSIVITRGSTELTLTEMMLISLENSQKESFYNGEAPFFVQNGIPIMGDGSEVPGGGVFPSSYYQYFVGDLGLDEIVTNYPEDGSTAQGDIAVLSINVLGYSSASMIAYDHVVRSNGNVKYVKTPYSHDGSSTTSVPEPTTMLLFGGALLAAGGVRIKNRIRVSYKFGQS